jgi:glycosyltransferase involved in cell wall biosynthesis
LLNHIQHIIDKTKLCQNILNDNFLIETKKMIRVLHFVGALNHGGIECWLMNLLRLQRPSIQFDFLTHAEGCFDCEAVELGATIHRHEMYHYYTYRDHLPLRNIILQGNYDVVHIHHYDFCGPILRIAKECGVPVRIAHSHNTQMGRGRFIVNTIKKIYSQWIDIPQINNYATTLLACSQETGCFYFGNLWKHKKPCKMVYCGIPLEPFDTVINPDIRKKLCELFKIPDNAIVIGTLGRLTYQKNHKFLIRLFEELAKRNTHYVLFIGGEGEERSNLEKQIQKLNLQNRVFLPGTVSNVPELLCQLFDVFVLPSRFEGFGIVLIESIAAGLNIVCSDIITLDLQKYLSDKMTLLNLQDSMSTWCDAIETGITKRISPKEGTDLVRATPFTIDNSMDALLSTYQYYLNK